MHGATTKQRLSALRRRLGIFTGAPRWVRERRERLAIAATKLAAERPSVSALLAERGTVPQPPRIAPSAIEWVSDSMVLSSNFAAPAGSAPASARAGDATTEVEERAVPARERGGRRRPWAIAAAAAAVAGLLVLFSLVVRGSPADEAAPSSQEAPIPAPPAAAAVPIPAPEESPAAVPPAVLEVRVGDTLWDLAARHLGDPYAWPRLHEANRDEIRDPDRIFPGQRIRLPAR